MRGTKLTAKFRRGYRQTSNFWFMPEGPDGDTEVMHVASGPVRKSRMRVPAPKSRCLRVTIGQAGMQSKRLRSSLFGGRCRFLLPGTCEPRLKRLSVRTLGFGTRTAYAARATGARLSLATVQFAPITVVAHRDKAITFTRSSILFRPHVPPTKEFGGAAGYRPRVRSAYSVRVYAHSRGCPRPN